MENTEPRADAEPVHSVCDILDLLRSTADRHDRVTIGNVLDAIGDRSYGPALLIPALLESTPLGGIPGVPTFLALFIALTAVQLLLDKDHLWMPGFIQKRSVSAGKLHTIADKLNPVAARLDRWFHGRMPQLVAQPWPRVAAGIVLALSLTVPPLEFVPFASSAPMLPIAAFGMALLVRDGLLMAVAMGISIAAVAIGVGLAR
ncbi:exopolysaccharide biosynthesis protein [Erythrobacter sp.]|uniref:exopolysaccharide biosynthesis protein n=1 Tax=Erythrobacter sp. TaxID=1042 RepID=UPI0025CF7246|nr:exopolysaccharide biosynthesis protein [Erythrobacter sp.]